LSFAGGGTDFPHYFREHGGAVLSATVNLYALVTLYQRADDLVKLRSLDMGEVVSYGIGEGPRYNGVLDLLKATIGRIGVECGVDVDVRSDAPAGSGLGGSSALVAACVAAVAAFRGFELTKHELARLAYVIEREDLEIPGGMQDQYATAFGGFNVIEFSANGVEVEPLSLRAETVEGLQARLMLCYMGRARTNTGLIDRQVKLYKEGRQETLLGMKRLREAVYSMRQTLLAGDLDQFGLQLHEAYVSKKMMNPHVVEGTPADILYERARELGAIGGKICGAGGGGYLMLYCDPRLQPRVQLGLESLGATFAPIALQEAALRVWKAAPAWATTA